MTPSCCSFYVDSVTFGIFHFIRMHPSQARNFVMTISNCVDEGIQLFNLNIKMLHPFNFVRVRYFPCMGTGGSLDKFVHICNSIFLDMDFFALTDGTC